LKTAALFGLVVVLAAGTGATYLSMSSKNSDKPPHEPVYQGKSLRQWIVSEPVQFPLTSHDDTMIYRQEALEAMGNPAIRYLRWMITHPELAFNKQPRPIDTPPPGLPPGRTWGWYPRAGVSHAVGALRLLGPKARAAAPELVRLWETKEQFSFSMELDTYNGFPITLGVLGDNSPEIIAAIHRHFNSRGAQHRGLCAVAAWRLNPRDTEAISLLQRELSTPNDFVRIALVGSLWQYGGQAPLTPFLPEIRAVIANDLANTLGDSVAKSAWHILKDPEPAKLVMQRLADTARRPAATADDVNRFAAAALNLAEIPGVNPHTAPVLKELSTFNDSSAAKFSSNILAMISGRQKRGPMSW